MPAATPELAKLSRPRLYRVTPRERLYRLLDELRDRPIVWITGGPGSGKTTLAAAYIESRKVSAIWYQVDSGDNDPATFFHYLGQAARSGRKNRPLPLLTEDYARDLYGFTRRFFRDFYARIPVGGMVVFDGFRSPPAASPMRGLVPAALGEIPSGISVLVLSREEPPPELARFVAMQSLARITEDELRFSADETAALIGADAEADSRVADALQRRSDGWAAGLILMREQLRQGESAGAAPRAADAEAVFGYFAGEFFNRIAPANQRVLMLAALLPRMTVPLVEALTGAPDVGRVLDYGFRRHLFISRRPGAEPIYEFHALFREFLLERARAKLPSAELRDLRRRAAGLLEAQGATDGVVELYGEAGDWESVTRVVLREAPRLLGQGRFRSVLHWTGALPDERLDAEPLLLLLRGMAMQQSDPGGAREDLERAYEGFARRDDVVGQLRAVAALTGSYYVAWEDFRPLDRWIDVMEALLARGPEFDSAETEARALSSLLIALVYRRPAQPSVPELTRRLLDLFDEHELDANTRVALAARLIDVLNKTGDFAASRRLAARIRPVMDDPGVSPVNRTWCRIWLANLLYFEGHLEEAEAVLLEALAIVHEYGLGFARQVVNAFRCLGFLCRGDLGRAAALLDELRANVERRRRLDAALLQFLEAWHALARGELAAAEREARVGAELSRATGSVPTTLICRTGLLVALEASGQRAEAARVLEEMTGLTLGLELGMLRFHEAMFRAWFALGDGAERSLPALRAALALARAQGYRNQYMWWPPMMSRLLSAALAAGIETDYVRSLITVRGVVPDERFAPREWPWPLSVQALGGFQLERAGEPVRFTGKAQKKPLELLKALVALGGRGVDWSRLAAVLWPDAAGDAAKVSFDSTLYRLRKLIGNDAVLVLTEGKLSLDPRHCWLDVWAFERAADDAAARVTGAAEADDIEAAARRVLDAYPGHFLAGEDDQPWLMGMRDRLRAKLVRVVLALGRRLQADRRWEQAAALYERSLELDNLAEDLYRGLMVCHRELGRPAEALRVYRRCRDMLSVVLGLKPSAETEAIRRTLGDAG